MKRRLFNFAVAVSLLLSLGMVVLCVRSISQADEISYSRDAGEIGGWPTHVADAVLLYKARLQYAHDVFRREPEFAKHDPPRQTGLSRNRPRAEVDFFQWVLPEKHLVLGFGTGHVRDWNLSMDDIAYGMSVPLWPLVVITFLLPLRWMLVARRRRARKNDGLCPSCGYCLTGNTSRVCPECGESVVAKSGA